MRNIVVLLTVSSLMYSVKASDPESDMDVVGMIRYWGYPAEAHDVVTTDGYILSLFRIPHGRRSDLNASCHRPVVLMAHGMNVDATVFILNPPESSPAFILADAGFDVFLLNHRGSTYSRRHVSLSPSENKFWQFTLDEFAKFDIPSCIDRALELSGERSLHWVGYSLGTITGFMTLAEFPEYNNKVKALFQVGPVGSFGHMRGPAGVGLPLLRPLLPILDFYRHSFGSHEVMPKTPWLYRSFASICQIPFLGAEICNDYTSFTLGMSSKSKNWTRIPVVLSHLPAGTSSWTYLHILQIAFNGRVEHMDHSPSDNLRKYGQTTPPPYNYSAVNVPVYLFWSRNDWATTAADIDNSLMHLLRKDIGGREIPEYSHLDFAISTDNAEKVWNPMVEMMRSMESDDVCTR